LHTVSLILSAVFIVSQHSLESTFKVGSQSILHGQLALRVNGVSGSHFNYMAELAAIVKEIKVVFFILLIE